jgi:hypothetical protein
MLDPQRLTTLWAFTACYRDSFTLLYFSLIHQLTARLQLELCLLEYNALQSVESQLMLEGTPRLRLQGRRQSKQEVSTK